MSSDNLQVGQPDEADIKRKILEVLTADQVTNPNHLNARIVTMADVFVELLKPVPIDQQLDAMRLFMQHLSDAMLAHYGNDGSSISGTNNDNGDPSLKNHWLKVRDFSGRNSKPGSTS